MNIYAFGPVAAALNGAYSVVQFLSAVLAPLAGANSTALALVLVTIAVRIVLIPVGLSQVRAQLTRERLAPRLAELRRRHGKDPVRLQHETSALYKAENASPFAGLLPLLLQAPVLSIVYGLFILPTIDGHSNGLLTHTLFGAPLGTSFAAALGAGEPLSIVTSGIVLTLITVVALLSRSRTLRQTAATAAVVSGAATPAVPGAATITRIVSWLPLITVFVAVFVPLAASLYLLVTTSWTFAERQLLRRALTRTPFTLTRA